MDCHGGVNPKGDMNTLNYEDPIPSRMSKLTVEGIAAFVSDKLDFGIGDPIEECIGKLGGQIKFGGNGDDEIEGGSILAKTYNDFIIYLSDLTSPKRDRFTIAHELGHLMLHLSEVKKKHGDGVGMRATRWVDDTDDDQRRAEWEANWFAAEFLMPRQDFRKVVDAHGVDYAASLFNVSLAAAKIRASSIEAS